MTLTQNQLGGGAKSVTSNSEVLKALNALWNRAGDASIVQMTRSELSWSRVWSDGFIEQGGIITTPNLSTITFAKPFSEWNYSLFTSYVAGIASAGANYAYAPREIPGTRTKTSVQVWLNSDQSQGTICGTYFACGY